MAPLKIIILGGGLSGSLLANGLINQTTATVDVVVYERDEQHANRKGYQIRLGSSALVGFRACLLPDQFDLVMKRFGRSGGVISSAPVLYDKNLSMLLDLRKFPAYSKSAPINRSMLRDLLQEPLWQKGILHYGRNFQKYEIIQTGEGGPSRVRAHFEDGMSAEADIIIAANGSNSSVNSQIGANNIVELSGRREGVVAKGDLPWAVLKTLPKELIETGTISCLSEGKTLFAAVYLPDNLAADRADGAFNVSKIDYDEEEASIMVGLTWPRDEADPPISNIKEEDKKSHLCDQIKSWHTGYHQMIQVVNTEDIYSVIARASNPIPKNWRQKARESGPGNEALGHPRVWMIGDAIHPMLPGRGMGANQALHDCAEALPAILDLALANNTKTKDDEAAWKAVKKYEDTMIPRAFKWVKKSGGTGRGAMPNMDGLRGKITLFIVARILDITAMLTWCARALGWKAEDDAPELL